MGETIAKVCM